jgi:hypothetical protein
LRAWQVLLFVSLFNVSIALLNQVPIYDGAHYSHFFYAANVVPDSNVNASTIASAIHCTQYANGTQSCTPFSPNPNTYSFFAPFGDWIDGMTMLISVAKGLFLPYYFIVAFGFPPLAATIYNLGMMFVWAGLVIYIITLRDPEGPY